MSHFVVLALLPPDTPATESEIERRLNLLFGPYDEGMEVAPYEQGCYCAGQEARAAAREHADEVAGLDEMRNVLQAELEAALKADERLVKLRKDFDWDPMGSTVSDKDHEYYRYGAREAASKALDHDRRWGEAVDRYEAAEKERLDAHPDREKADPECDECSGSGKVTSTYNPDSKWDWFQVGGRWSGMLLGDDYKIQEDEDNYESCSVCGGTGKRDDELGREERKKHPGYSCNGCRGKGKTLRFAAAGLAEPPAGGNWRVVREIPDSALPPFAIMTPDGKWHEKGKMMMFAAVADEKPEDDWGAEARSVLGDYQDHLAVVVDCHI